MSGLKILGTASLLGLSTAIVVPLHAGPPADAAAAIVHVLNRVAFGPTTADIERLGRVGIRQYIAEQLHPERIDNSALDRRLSGFSTLSMSSSDIAERFEIPLRMERRERKQDAAATPVQPQERQRRPVQSDANLPMAELSQQKVLRAVYSERQLEEVLTDFWFNHFNVDAKKGPTRYMLTEYERDAIRPHVLGRFRDLLEATAKSPAMLFYLDNWMSADPGAADRMAANRGRMRARRGSAGAAADNMPPQAANMRRGLNENYGRELLELHTLGVDGGYTQRDVTEVARAFTGWTIDRPRGGGSFRFMPALHDEGDKKVLGRTIKAGGERDGEEVLDILATHPSTARFISRKLAARFVSDDPPAALVDRLSKSFRDSGGDLRAVMTMLLTSPEFLSADAYGAKVKTPFDFVASALRTAGAPDIDARPIVRTLQSLGMPPYQCQPPTGYKDAGDSWINTGALVNRMNVALSLAQGPLRIGERSDVDAAALVRVPLSETTRETIAKAGNRAEAIALALGSPEFQKR